MTLWAVMMVKDEEDVIEPVLRHIAAQGVTGIMVADNDSHDRTLGIISRVLPQLGCQYHLVTDPEVGYWQSRKMTALADEAHRLGATWIWPCDADELWYYGTDTARLSDVVAAASGDAIYARLWHHFVTALDPEIGSAFTRMVYRSPTEAPLRKVIVRWKPGALITAGNHDVIHPMGPRPSSQLDVQIRHFPYRSQEQFVRKAINGSLAYAATDLPLDVGQHWREYGLLYERGGVQALRDAYQAHFVYDLPSAQGLVWDPARLDK